MNNKTAVIMIIVLLGLLFSSCGREKQAKPNILLITIDTLRRDHLGIYGYPRETSPFMDRLAREGMMFRHAITPIPSTAASHASILTSLHPLTHGVTSNAAPLTDKAQTIAEVLKQNGYYTIGTISAAFLSRRYNFNQGFDSFSDEWPEKPKMNSSFHRVAESVNESLFKQINEYLANPQQKDKPLFIWVHYYDPHWYYRDIKSITFKTQLREHPEWKVIERYDKEIRYTDEHIKKLFALLEEKGLAKQMVTCITADHGEEFGEHGRVHAHADIYSENTFVPLILHGYGVPKNKVIDQYVSTMDIPVTLLGKANLNFDNLTEGIDLVETYKKSTVPGERKLLIIGNAKFTRSLQLMAYPLAYILNFDHHYKHWFISHQSGFPVPGDRFKPIKKGSIKSKKGGLEIHLPHVLKEGLNYALFRANIKENKGLSLKVKMLPFSFTQEVKISPEIKTFTIIYPIAIQDRVIVIITPDQGTIIDTQGLSAAIIAKEEFPNNPGPLQKLENHIYKKIAAQRKGNDKDELFDLSRDIEMKNDLIQTKKFKTHIPNYHRLTYTAFKYYYKMGRKLLKGTISKENLTEEEKNMLKSLGYL